MDGFIHSIESGGTVDGPGVRFVIFLQGCPLRCLYCHNPDTWEIGIGKRVTVDELYEEFNKKRPFYKNGGLTVSGGEALLQIDFVTELFAKFKREGVHTCLDTSGITFQENNHEKMDKLMEVTDLILLDLKHIDDKFHQKLTRASNKNILAFAKYLSAKKVPIWVRHVVVPKLNDDEESLFKLGQFIGELENVQALDVLPYHTMGVVKYENLGIDYPLKGYDPLPGKEAVRARNIIINGIKDTRRKQKNEIRSN